MPSNLLLPNSPTSYCPRVEFVVDTTPDYTVGDQIGDAVEVTNAARFTGGGGTLDSLTVILHVAQFVSFELFFFDANPTSANDDNAAIDISDADVETALFSVFFPAGRLAAPSATDYFGTINVDYKYQCSGTSLWVVAKAVDTTNFAATDDFQLRLGLTRD